jgi:hypothetical protein
VDLCESRYLRSSFRLLPKVSAQARKLVAAKRMLKKMVFWLLLFVPVLAICETASYIIIKRAVPSRILHRVRPREVTTSASQLGHAADKPKFMKAAASGNAPPGLMLFHSALGWDYPPGLAYEDAQGVSYCHGPQGERRCTTDYDTTLIATYGDSFTYCLSAGDEDTWQNFLGKRLGTNVLNFGVGGYGTDQALLKYELHEGPPTKIVMLCVLPENINRVVNIYRPFYTYEDPLRLTKPVFVRDGKNIRLIPNPLTSEAELSRLDQEQFLEALGRIDYWYQLDKRLPKFSFPYVFSLVSWRGPVFSQLVERMRGLSSGKIRHSWNLFDEEGPLSIMCHIADRFVATARSRGSEPLIVIMPHKDYVTEITDRGMVRVSNFLEYLSRKNYPFLDAVKCMAEMKPSKEELETWYESHATPRGNRVLATILSRYLKANYPLLSEGSEKSKTVVEFGESSAVERSHDDRRSCLNR